MTQESFNRKIASKFSIRRWVGELYVGKRMKWRYFAQRLEGLRPKKDGKVMEVGSEDGWFTEWIDRKWSDVTVEGLDVDASHVAACQAWTERTRRSPKLTFRHGDLLSLAIEGEYDRIFCLDVLGYIIDDSTAVRNLARALRPGGWLIVHQPNTQYRTFGGLIHEVSSEMAGQITKGHVRHGYAPKQLRALLERAGLEIRTVEAWHGRFSDVAHRVYRSLEKPALLRFLALPVVDALWLLDQWWPGQHGNTVYAIATKPLSQ